MGSYVKMSSEWEGGPVFCVRCHHWIVQRQGRWRRTLWAGSMEPLVDMVGPRATSLGGSGNPKETLLPLGGTASIQPMSSPHPEPPPHFILLLLRVSHPPAFPASCTEPQRGQGPGLILLSLCLCPEGGAVSRFGLFTSIPLPYQLLSLANSYTSINTQPSSAGKPGSE